MSVPIAQFLVEFGVCPPPIAFAGPLPGVASAEHILAERIAEARADGVREAMEKASLRQAAAEDALRAEHDRRLGEVRRDWAATEGAVLAQVFADRMGALEADLATAVAAVLEPLLPMAAAVKALAECRIALATLLAGGEPAIRVSGRRDLIDALARTFDGSGAIAFEASDRPDVAIVAGDTRIATHLAPWAERLATEIGTLA